MRVKIGNNVYDSSQEPVMLILDEQDKINIRNMSDEATKFCSFPDSMSAEEVKEFMKIERDEKL